MKNSKVWIDSQGGWNVAPSHEVSTAKWTEADWSLFAMMSPEVRLAYSSWVRGGSWIKPKGDSYASPQRFTNEVVLAK
jgi:hypothetical protein